MNSAKVMPDPVDPEVGIDASGDIVRRLHAARMHDDGTPPSKDEFEHVGWIKGIEWLEFQEPIEFRAEDE